MKASESVNRAIETELPAPKARNMKASESVKRDRNRAPSAEGAEYDSQGQALSASPLVTHPK